MANNAIVELIGKLNQQKTQKQLNADLKQLSKLINALEITGVFAKNETTKQLNQYIKQLQSQLNHIQLKAKLDSKKLKAEIDQALTNVSFKEIDVNIDENAAKLKIQKAIAEAKSLVQKNPISIELKKEKLSDELNAYLDSSTKLNHVDSANYDKNMRYLRSV